MTRLSPALQTPLRDEQAPLLLLLLVCQEVRACWMERAELLRENDRTIKAQERDARVQADKAQLAESCAQ